MDQTRRAAVAALFASAMVPGAQVNPPDQQVPLPDLHDEDRRMPDGKSQNDAIARQQHEAALKDASEMVALAQQIHDEVEKAGNYVVPVSTLKKTEEIEKLARKIRGRLKG